MLIIWKYKIMPKIILTRGIQGSGKTTWAKKWTEENPIGAEILKRAKEKGNDWRTNIKN